MEMIYADENMGRNIGKVTYINGVFTINRYDAYQDGNTAWEIYIDLWGLEIGRFLKWLNTVNF